MIRMDQTAIWQKILPSNHVQVPRSMESQRVWRLVSEY